MTFSNNGLYTQSGNLAFGASSTQMDAFLLRGSRSIYRPSLPLIIEVLMSGVSPVELGKKGYTTSMAESMKQWNLNMTQLHGNSIMADGSPGMINVLPAGNFNFTVYEDAVPEVTKFNTVSATDTGALATKIVFSAADAAYFSVDDLIVNWSKSATNVGRVTAVSYTDANPFISVTAYGGTAAMSTSIFMAAAGDGAAVERVEIIGSAVDLRNGTRPSARTPQDFRAVAGVSTYNLQSFEDIWDVPNTFDAPQRAFGSKANPVADRNKLEAMYKHLNKLSRHLLWGSAQNLTGTGNDRQGFAGINRSISSNVTSLADGLLSLSDIDEMLVSKLGGTYSSNILYGFCSIPTLQIVETLFNTLGSNSCGNFVKYPSGYYGMEIGVIRYRGREIHLIPVADFMNMGDRTFVDQNTTAGANLAGNLFLVDPESIFTVVGTHAKRGTILFDVEENVQDNQESFYQSRNMLRTWMSFALRHEKTSGIIKNIRRADLLG